MHLWKIIDISNDMSSAVVGNTTNLASHSLFCHIYSNSFRIIGVLTIGITSPPLFGWRLININTIFSNRLAISEAIYGEARSGARQVNPIITSDGYLEVDGAHAQRDYSGLIAPNLEWQLDFIFPYIS